MAYVATFAEAAIIGALADWYAVVALFRHPFGLRRDAEYMKRIAGDIHGGALRDSAERVRKHLRHVRWASDYGYYLQLRAAFGWSSLPWLRFLPQPTLVMAGNDDPLVPAINGRILARLIPDARLVTVDDGHLFLVTSAPESARMVAGFLD